MPVGIGYESRKKKRKQARGASNMMGAQPAVTGPRAKGAPGIGGGTPGPFRPMANNTPGRTGMVPLEDLSRRQNQRTVAPQGIAQNDWDLYQNPPENSGDEYGPQTDARVLQGNYLNTPEYREEWERRNRIYEAGHQQRMGQGQGVGQQQQGQQQLGQQQIPQLAFTPGQGPPRGQYAPQQAPDFSELLQQQQGQRSDMGQEQDLNRLPAPPPLPRDAQQPPQQDFGQTTEPRVVTDQDRDTDAYQQAHQQRTGGYEAGRAQRMQNLRSQQRPSARRAAIAQSPGEPDVNAPELDDAEPITHGLGTNAGQPTAQTAMLRQRQLGAPIDVEGLPEIGSPARDIYDIRQRFASGQGTREAPLQMTPMQLEMHNLNMQANTSQGGPRAPGSPPPPQPLQNTPQGVAPGQPGQPIRGQTVQGGDPDPTYRQDPMARLRENQQRQTAPQPWRLRQARRGGEGNYQPNTIVGPREIHVTAGEQTGGAALSGASYYDRQNENLLGDEGRYAKQRENTVRMRRKLKATRLGISEPPAMEGVEPPQQLTDAELNAEAGRRRQAGRGRIQHTAPLQQTINRRRDAKVGQFMKERAKKEAESDPISGMLAPDRLGHVKTWFDEWETLTQSQLEDAIREKELTPDNLREYRDSIDGLFYNNDQVARRIKRINEALKSLGGHDKPRQASTPGAGSEGEWSGMF